MHGPITKSDHSALWAPGPPKMNYSIIQLKSDFDLITLSQNLFNKSISKMAGNVFDM